MIINLCDVIVELSGHRVLLCKSVWRQTICQTSPVETHFILPINYFMFLIEDILTSLTCRALFKDLWMLKWKLTLHQNQFTEQIHHHEHHHTQETKSRSAIAESWPVSMIKALISVLGRRVLMWSHGFENPVTCESLQIVGESWLISDGSLPLLCNHDEPRRMRSLSWAGMCLFKKLWLLPSVLLIIHQGPN